MNFKEVVVKNKRILCLLMRLMVARIIHKEFGHITDK